jgi:peptidoglycan/LPS O-acetylase OafA/YrhL
MSNIAINYTSYLDVKEIPSLNGWRAIAVIIVILGHLKVMLFPDHIIHKILDNFVYPEFGVRIFFVISGFLITTLLIREKQKMGSIDLGKFFIRRFLRIVPALWLYLIVITIWNHVFDFELTFSYFLGPLLYLNNFNFFPGTWVLGHTWSLAVEEQYYLIWPFVFYAYRNLLSTALFFVIFTPIIITITYFKPNLSEFLLEPFLRPAAAILPEQH